MLIDAHGKEAHSRAARSAASPSRIQYHTHLTSQPIFYFDRTRVVTALTMRMPTATAMMMTMTSHDSKS